MNKNLTTLYSKPVEIEINGKILIHASDIAINTGMKYFVMGCNGCGKTTLLKHIYADMKDTCDILMLDQDIEISHTDQTVQDFILYADRELYTKVQRMNALELIEELSDDQNDEYTELSEYCSQREYDRYEAESKRILHGLGFTKPTIPVNILSGGWRMRLALGKALLRKPTVLVLDEPTNHLDIHAVIWLTDYLKSYSKTLIVITHQIAFVNSIADAVWYIGNPELKFPVGNGVYTIRGKYDNLLKTLDNFNQESKNKYDKFQKRVDELKKKSTPKKEVEEFVKKNNVMRPPKEYMVNITFDDVVRLSTKNIIEFRDVGFRFTDRLIYENVNLNLGMGTRMIMVGENGVGKTTFLKLASQELVPCDGTVYCDERLRVGYYNQQIVDSLPLGISSIEYLQQMNEHLSPSECRAILGKLGLKKTDTIDLPMNKIGDLSGGQKARVSFAKLQMQNPHLILLDEPTNHLDVESIDGLIKGINEFNGGIVVITHDIYLIENIANAELYNVENHGISKINGDFEHYCDLVLNSTNN